MGNLPYKHKKSSHRHHHSKKRGGDGDSAPVPVPAAASGSNPGLLGNFVGSVQQGLASGEAGLNKKHKLFLENVSNITENAKSNVAERIGSVRTRARSFMGGKKRRTVKRRSRSQTK